MELSVSLNVGGKVFMTSRETLGTYPDTFLGKLVTENKGTNKSLELSFDRNPKVFHSVLDFYRTGELHLPKNVCATVAERELRFWGIPMDLMSHCCWNKYEKDKNSAKIVAEIDHFLKVPLRDEDQKQLPISKRIWLTMEFADYSPLAKVWNILYVTAVLLSVTNCILQSTSLCRELRPELRELEAEHKKSFNLSLITTENRFITTVPYLWLLRSEYVIVAFLSFDFTTRLLVCPRKAEFLTQFKNGLDLLLLVHFAIIRALAQYWLPTRGFHKPLSDIEKNAYFAFASLIILRSLRVLYFAKDFDAMKILWLSTKSSMKELLLLILCVITFVTLFGATVFVSEYMAQTFVFSSILSGMWWAIVTMTTVGYGDVYPLSPAGQLVGALCALSGVIVLAMPVAILASRFTDYHDNLSSQKQLRRTSRFLRKHPQFSKELCQYPESGVRWEDVVEEKVKHAEENMDVQSQITGLGMVDKLEENPTIQCGKRTVFVSSKVNPQK